jgi:predicted Ser/Thr protein kinase
MPHVDSMQQPMHQPEDLASPDRLVADRYRVVAIIGQGGMGRVLLAEDQLLGRQVALKQIQLPSGIPGAERAQVLDRVRREARIAANLDHPGIVRVHDIVEYQSSPVIVMEYLNGRSLGAVIREDGPVHPTYVAQIAASVLQALGHAHAAGVVHRDLKPDNIVLTRDGRTVLTDFGIARMADGGTALTTPGTVPGTPAFMSPEQIEGREVSGAADLWSLGATLYAALEGRPPFDGDTMTELCVAILTQPAPSSLHAGELGPLLGGLLAKDVSQRATVPQALQFLAEVQSRAPYAAPLSTIADRVDSGGPYGGFGGGYSPGPGSGFRTRLGAPRNEARYRAPAITVAVSAVVWLATLFLPALSYGHGDSLSGSDALTGKIESPYVPMVWLLAILALILGALAAVTLVPPLTRHAAPVCWAAIPVGLALVVGELALGVVAMGEYQSSCDGGGSGSFVFPSLFGSSNGCYNAGRFDLGFYLGVVTAALVVGGGIWALIIRTRAPRVA